MNKGLHVFSDGEGDFVLAYDTDDLVQFFREQQITDPEELSEAFIELDDDSLIGDEEQPPSEWKTCKWHCQNYGRGYLGEPK